MGASAKLLYGDIPQVSSGKSLLTPSAAALETERDIRFGFNVPYSSLIRHYDEGICDAVLVGTWRKEALVTVAGRYNTDLPWR